MKGELRQKNGSAFLTVPCYFWIGLLFGGHDKRRTSSVCAADRVDAKLMCVCVMCEAIV